MVEVAGRTEADSQPSDTPQEQSKGRRVPLWATLLTGVVMFFVGSLTQSVVNAPEIAPPVTAQLGVYHGQAEATRQLVGRPFQSLNDAYQRIYNLCDEATHSYTKRIHLDKQPSNGALTAVGLPLEAGGCPAVPPRAP